MPQPSLPARFEGDSAPLGVDLHMHSTASDGALAPAEVVALCAARGVRLMALTDHDTVAGVAEAGEAAIRLGVSLLPATELSTRWHGVGIHVVGLLPQGARGALAEGLEAQARAREARAEEIAGRMEKLGLDDALARAREQAGPHRPLGRPDFARALVAAGLVPDMATAFRKHLGSGKAGDVKAHWPALAEVVGWVVEAGGVAVLAHPLRYGLTRRKRGQLLDDFIAAGGQAAELVSGFQNADVTRDLARQLDERALHASLGSDFHFPGGHLAPGSMSPPPRTAVPPVWTHPLLAGVVATGCDASASGAL
ncbi:PHP domain-containing protein [Halomonas sp. MCCC 1A17488]|uniref:PHP domain-containing protein n=1 Tax=unclassified Halomonas TaxID=2609666 RepID=UPI0018D220CE|nr:MULTISPECIES: PHP domain-containing protein [unclassified Halomonas]MCE8016654.1 PHP domain-containing protein [Halomonas sp. MCCC 1A17488]MCG3239987.1 PHP domain-containing protein [Halomonas sp. MCCC 1A17488]QPP50123.1 PHP domain-containing protein [Halomonas sp. SS10-MC5]